jgi:hypothetical protein
LDYGRRALPRQRWRSVARTYASLLLENVALRTQCVGYLSDPVYVDFPGRITPGKLVLGNGSNVPPSQGADLIDNAMILSRIPALSEAGSSAEKRNSGAPGSPLRSLSRLP